MAIPEEEESRVGVNIFQPAEHCLEALYRFRHSCTATVDVNQSF